MDIWCDNGLLDGETEKSELEPVRGVGVNENKERGGVSNCMLGEANNDDIPEEELVFDELEADSETPDDVVP